MESLPQAPIVALWLLSSMIKNSIFFSFPFFSHNLTHSTPILLTDALKIVVKLL